uniref:DNA primase n=1 Tax=Heterorhabditis bacteriophora TaxID=37862 RepID=A0A1I7XSC6_HETBA
MSSGKKNQREREVHPMVETAYRTTMDSGEFDCLVLEQRWLEFESAIEILNYCEDSELRAVLKAQFERLETPELRWKALKCRFDEKYRAECMEQKKELPPAVSGVSRDFLRWFVLWHSYPRLDINVSTGLNHLLKSPFCIHPKTGNVAVPLDINTIHEFDVGKCPRIDILISELAKSVDNSEDIKENRKILGYKHTSLAPYVVNFEKFISIGGKNQKWKVCFKLILKTVFIVVDPFIFSVSDLVEVDQRSMIDRLQVALERERTTRMFLEKQLSQMRELYAGCSPTSPTVPPPPSLTQLAHEASVIRPTPLPPITEFLYPVDVTSRVTVSMPPAPSPLLTTVQCPSLQAPAPTLSTMTSTPSSFSSSLTAHRSLQTILDAIRHLEGGALVPPSPPPTSQAPLVR